MNNKSKHLIYILNLFNLPVKQLNIDKLINFYPYGSHIYGTNTDKSDYDYIAVMDQTEDMLEHIYTADKTMNILCYSPVKFLHKVQNHDIDALECIFLPDDMKYEIMTFPFVYDIEKLRRSIAAVSSNSWVKCKKKLQEGEDYIGKKSLFHSLRIADFGIQIAEQKDIITYTKPYETDVLTHNSWRDLWYEINAHQDWDSLKKDYNEIANQMRTNFRKAAPWDNFDKKFEMRENK